MTVGEMLRFSTFFLLGISLCCGRTSHQNMPDMQENFLHFMEKRAEDASASQPDMQAMQENLLYLMEKPYEDISMPRGPNDSMMYMIEGQGNVFPGMVTPPKVIHVAERPEASAQNLREAMMVPTGTAFSTFLPAHRKAAKSLLEIFKSARTPEDLMEIAANAHSMVNKDLYIYSFSLAIVLRSDLGSITLPSFPEIFPNKFIPEEELVTAQGKVDKMTPDDTTPVVIQHGPQFSGTFIKPEHRLAYWREDYGINSHHWHWHLIYPIEMGVNRDRKGELFFYMHQQVIARYDIERLCLDFARVESLDNWRVPVKDGYFPKLTVGNSGKAWGTRQDDTMLKDFRRNDFGLEFVDISDLENWRDRLMDAIHRGFMETRNGTRIPLSDDVTEGKRGIETLGDTFEADGDLSVNYPFYGDLHNLAHVIIAFSHDNDYAHREEVGVMGDSGTAMRDPVFYRLHKFVDNLFQEYKLTQTPYPEEDLTMSSVEVEKIGTLRDHVANVLHTGWSVRQIEASRGLAFKAHVPVMVNLTHLDHASFDYHFRVNNKHDQRKEVTMRVFLAPKYNSRNHEMSFMEQRILWAEMDKFTTVLKPGQNHIVRPSTESSITNQRDHAFRDLEKGRSGDPGTPESSEFDFSGCGWPQHMLLPRGKPGGMTFQLLLMVTDFAQDSVEQTVDVMGRRANGCSFCGILDAKYPDRRPMGFPFDRRPPKKLMDQDVNTIWDFARLPNVGISDISIVFLDHNLDNTDG